VRSSKFPNNITDVVYSPGQFGPVSNGQLADRLAIGVSSGCRQAAEDALNGATNVGDAKSQANNYDVVFCSESLVGTFTGTKAKVIGLKNLLAEKEMEEKIKANIVDA
jgi:galactitol-specific phosphotransferase system IIB component